MPRESLDLVFGCRSPTSKGIGKWDGAFVYCRNIFLCQMMVYFEDEVYYISKEPVTLNDAVKEYNTRIKEGWLPMSPKDLEETCGVVIDEYTKLDIPLREFD